MGSAMRHERGQPTAVELQVWSQRTDSEAAERGAPPPPQHVGRHRRARDRISEPSRKKVSEIAPSFYLEI